MDSHDSLYKTMKPTILFILHLPPPVHGASMMGKYIHDSRVVNDAFECRYFNLTLAKDLQDIGKGGLRKLIYFIKQITALRNVIKAENPNLCYVTPNAKGGAFYKDFLIVMMLKAMRKKVIVHYHNKGVSTRQNKVIDNFLYRHFFKNLKVILLADTLYNDVRKYVNKEDVYICPNGIPETINIKKRVHDGFNILFLSNMMREKGVWDLIDACKILKDKGLNFHCHFIGKWSDISEETFNDRINALGLQDCVNAYGAKYGEEKNEFFENTDVFVFPTFYHNETFGLVLLEAMQYSIPCISTDEGGIPFVIEDGKTGFVIEKHQSKILADKLVLLIDNPNLCNEMGNAGRKKFEQEFTLNQFEKRIAGILNDALTKY